MISWRKKQRRCRNQRERLIFLTWITNGLSMVLDTKPITNVGLRNNTILPSAIFDSLHKSYQSNPPIYNHLDDKIRDQTRSNFENFNNIHNVGTTAITYFNFQFVNAIITISVMFARQNDCISVGFLACNTFFSYFLFLCLPVLCVSSAFIGQTGSEFEL